MDLLRSPRQAARCVPVPRDPGYWRLRCPWRVPAPAHRSPAANICTLTWGISSGRVALCRMLTTTRIAGTTRKKMHHHTTPLFIRSTSRYWSSNHRVSLSFSFFFFLDVYTTYILHLIVLSFSSTYLFVAWSRSTVLLSRCTIATSNQFYSFAWESGETLVTGTEGKSFALTAFRARTYALHAVPRMRGNLHGIEFTSVLVRSITGTLRGIPTCCEFVLEAWLMTGATYGRSRASFH